jgi:Rad3-related DNA helicase
VPEGFTLRRPQEQILGALGPLWDQYDNFIISAPVGVGKSLIAMTISNAMNDAHILTPYKDLQRQYASAFTDGVAVIAGKSNYDCTFKHPEEARAIYKIIDSRQLPARNFRRISCGSEERPCTTQSGRFECLESGVQECPFDYAMRLAQTTRIAVHNVMGFCYHAALGEKFSVRDVIIVDEAHAVEDVLRNVGVYELELTPGEVDILDIGKRTIPNAARLADKFMEIRKIREALDSTLPDLPLEGRYAEMSKEDGSGRVLKLIPKSTGPFGQRFIGAFGRKRVFLSGSISDKDHLRRSLGLSPERTFFMNMDRSPFPVENRLIVIPHHLAISMGFGNRDDNHETLVEGMKEILGRHSGQKGVIHSNSYDLTKRVGAVLGERVTYAHSGREHQKTLSGFLATSSPKVLVSPAVSEGVDLKGDLARFQMVLTLSNFPPIMKEIYGDEYFKMNTRKSMETLMQQVGRVTRSGEDYGITYILDSRALKLVQNGKFPKWFSEAVRIETKKGELVPLDKLREPKYADLRA